MLEQKSAVLFYTDLLLPPSMTFIRAEGEALERFTTYYVGSRAVARGGLRLPPERTLVINRTGSNLGKALEIPFKVFGWDPLFFRRVRKLNPVLIHAHFGPGAAVALPLAEELHLPMIVTFHGYDVTMRMEFTAQSHYSFGIYLRKKELIQKRSRLFIAVSQFIRRKLLEQGYPDDKIIVHYIGIDTDFFRPDPQMTREPIVLFTGNLVEVKGCEYLIQAMAKVQKKSPETELVIIGDGPLRPGLENLARRTLRGFRFLGVQPPAVVKSWMNRSKVFCVASTTARTGACEAFGLVFAEAQAMSLPVVSFSSGGVPEAVLHSETGLLAPDKDWECLAQHISLLITNDDMRERMGDAGRQRVCAHFDLQKQTRKLESLYWEVLAEAH